MPIVSARALLFGWVLIAPKLTVYIISGGISPQLFSDWDEPLYLPFTIALGRTVLEVLSGGEFDLSGIYMPLGYPTAHNFADLLVGVPAAALQMSPVALGILLDSAITPVVYLLARRLFLALTEDRFAAEGATIAFLLLPWLFPLSAYFLPQSVGSLVIAPRSYYPCPPILRGLYTQLSYPFICIALSMLIRGRSPIRLGVMTGLLIYIYLFAWMSVTAIVFLALLLRRSSHREVVHWIVSHLLVSAPGILFTFAWHPPAAYNIGEISSAVWYFPPELLLVIALSWRRKLQPRCWLAFAVAGAEIGLMNIQTLSGVLLEPHHFITFYLHPILSGLLVLLVLERVRLSSLRRTAVVCVLLLATLLYVVRPLITSVGGDEAQRGLIHYVREDLSEDDVIVILPYHYPFDTTQIGLPHRHLLPYWVAAFTGRPTEPLPASFAVHCPSELATGFAFLGRVERVGSCPLTPQSDHHPLLTALPYHHAARFRECERMERERHALHGCDLVNKCRMDYVLWAPELLGNIVTSPPPFLSLRWESVDGQLALYAIDRRKLNCPPQPASDS